MSLCRFWSGANRFTIDDFRLTIDRQFSIGNRKSTMPPMNLQPGCRYAVAPHFHMTVDWSQRLLIGVGVDECNGCFVARNSWRPPTPDELSLLAHASPEVIPQGALEESLLLCQFPAHLRAAWWALLEQNADVLGRVPIPGFDAFANQVAEFLEFKQLPMPKNARCDVVLSDVAQPASESGAEANRLEGLSCNLPPWTPWPLPEERSWREPWGGINLGDEETSIVFVNLPYARLDEELRRRFPDQPAPATVGELADRFLRRCADYPPVRLILKPGEGFRLPRCGLILGRYLADKHEPDVVLLISQDDGSSVPS
jgi:hypothetical protein